MHVVGIRSKVLNVLGLPVLVLALASGAASFTAVQDARDTRAVGAFAAAQDGALRVQAALQAERLASLTPADRIVGAATDLPALRAATDREIEAFERALAGTRVTDAAPEAAAAITAAQTAHGRLADLRRLVDGGPADPALRASVREGYAAVIAADVDLPGAVGEVLADRELGRRLAIDSLLARAGEATARAYLTGVTVIAAGTATAEQQGELVLAQTDRTRALDGFRAQASLSTPAEVSELTAAAAAVDALAARLADGTGGPVDQAQWTAAHERLGTGVRGVARRVATDAALSAERLAVAAEQRAALVGGAAVAVVGLMVLLALMQSRRITDPLLRLASAATTSRERLPEVVDAVVHQQPDVELPRIDITTRDEIGAVAAAFRDVQSTVVDIAQQQAALRVVLAETFVNVARRNQVLLGRQLALVDRLERTEEDPGALENLFRLDHLATRMRRNAESLLVLAGIDSGRQLRQAMPASDVVRTAISEIEQYERVQVYAEADPAVVAHQALPLAHLIAELIENATQFSDPATSVVVHVGDAGGRVQIVVRDNGLGMSLDDLVEANARLDAYRDHAPVGAEAIGSQRLGLFVVARLAARLGAQVRLHSRSGGTEAVVDLPSAVFVAAGPDDAIVLPPTPEPFPEPFAESFPEPLPAPIPASEPVAPQSFAVVDEPVIPVFDLAPLPRRGARTDPEPAAFVEPVHVESVAQPAFEPAFEPAAEPVLEPAPLGTPPRGMVDVLPKQVQRNHFGLGMRGRRSRRVEEPEPFLPPAPAPTAAPQPVVRTAAPQSPIESPSPDRPAPDDALRSALASQALTELSLLAAYRPTSEQPSAASLARRAANAAATTVQLPAAEVAVMLPPEEPVTVAAAREARTPEGVRSMLSAFAAGAARGRGMSG